MREIKFRMWGIDAFHDYDPNTKYDEDGNALPRMISSDALCFEECKPLCDLLRDTDEAKFMQYTGLKDARGTEIYEGDIVTIGIPKPGSKDILYGVVCWNDEEAKFSVYWKYERPPEDELASVPLSLGCAVRMLYIMGNIYENPDLLPKEHDDD